MLNIDPAKLLVILVVALVVLGPEQLPGAIRRVGQVLAQLRKMVVGFQNELRDTLDEPMRDLQGTVELLRNPLGALADAATQEPTPTPAGNGFAPPSGEPVPLPPPATVDPP